MRIVFLDFDGVLNSRAHLLHVASLPYSPDDAEQALVEKLIPLREKSRFNFSQKGAALLDLRSIDPQAVGRLNDLLREPEVEVVVSSSWRKDYTVAGLQFLLGIHGFIGRVIGKTPEATDLSCRGDEIQRWVDEHRAAGGVIDSLVILDDYPDMKQWAYRLVRTDFKTGGLLPKHIARAREILAQPLE